uniref:aspartate transaminase n=1 Tax=Eutreptiella gymnastica TaxID=73025 RepID=A0A7S4CQE4_9EUGL
MNALHSTTHPNYQSVQQTTDAQRMWSSPALVGALVGCVLVAVAAYHGPGTSAIEAFVTTPSVSAASKVSHRIPLQRKAHGISSTPVFPRPHGVRQSGTAADNAPHTPEIAGNPAAASRFQWSPLLAIPVIIGAVAYVVSRAMRQTPTQPALKYSLKPIEVPSSVAVAMAGWTSEKSQSRKDMKLCATTTDQSLFEDVAMAPPDPILGVTQAFKACESPDKLNLGVGAYRSEEGKPWVLPTVKAAEAKLLELQEAGAINKEYLPIDGIPEFYSAALKLMLGDDCTPLKEGRVCSVQCLSGTGGLRLAAACIGQFQKGASIYVPNPTWGNHNKIFPREGVPVKSYTYYKPETCGLDFEGMCADLNAMPSGSVVLLHACAHNPTGVDPTEEQWAEIASIVKKRGLVPLIDSAYQGFASGDFDKDAWACRYFAEQGMELYLVQSFAKNMGLYGERTGVLSIICQDQDNAARLKSQIKPFIRTMYSSPPQHGARIAELILNDPQQLEAWKAEVKVMADRIIKMRQLLYQELKANECPGEWEHVINQIGMFTFTGLTPEQVDVLTQKYSIFLTKDGRISMAGLREEKCKYLADAMKDAILTHP